MKLVDMLRNSGAPIYDWAALQPDLLPQRAEALAIKIAFSGQAGGAFAFGNPTQQQHAGGWALAGLLKHGVGQNDICALTLSTAIGREKGVRSEAPSRAAGAAWAHQTSRVAVLFEPRTAGTSIEQVSEWNVNHTQA